jgi:O-antigen ligase
MLTSLLIIGLVLLLSRNTSLFTNLVNISHRFLSTLGSFLSGQPIKDAADQSRYMLWLTMLSILKYHPLTGTGFAGIYLFNPTQGSSHSQIMDVLFKMGIIGALGFLYMYYYLLKHYYKVYPAVFTGLIGVFVFGAVNETIKLSYGAALFFILLNLAIAYRERNENNIGDEVLQQYPNALANKKITIKEGGYIT